MVVIQKKTPGEEEFIGGIKGLTPEVANQIKAVGASLSAEELRFVLNVSEKSMTPYKDLDKLLADPENEVFVTFYWSLFSGPHYRQNDRAFEVSFDYVRDLPNDQTMEGYHARRLVKTAAELLLKDDVKDALGLKPETQASVGSAPRELVMAYCSRVRRMVHHSPKSLEVS